MIEAGDKVKILKHPNDNKIFLSVKLVQLSVIISVNLLLKFIQILYMIGNTKFNTALFDEKELEVIEKYNGSVIINV